MKDSDSYLMESNDEAYRLDIKTDRDAVIQQARWCGIGPGARVLEAGCGSGKTTSILCELIQPGGEIVGVDFSEDRILYAQDNFGSKNGIEFLLKDITQPLDDLGEFDFIWVKLVLEYFRVGSLEIVRNLSQNLKPAGYLCLLDLDYNCLTHYGMSQEMENILLKIMEMVQLKLNFDPYAGRKLYSYLFDIGFRDIEVNLKPYHLIYGETKPGDDFTWIKKLEIITKKTEELFENYRGGCDKFYSDCLNFFNNPRRFTYTPLIICKGKKPA